MQNSWTPSTESILLIEDSILTVKCLTLVLMKQGWQVESAGTLEEGLARLSKGGIAAVLLDLSLPDSSGLNTFLQVEPYASDLPVVVLTGLNDEQMALEAMQRGAQDYLVKGLPSYESLVRCLRYSIERKQIETKIRNLNDELEQRVQERTLELARSNAELKQFTKVAAHDLQEPLRVVEGYAQLLCRRYKDRLDEDANEFLDYIIDGTRRMTQLIKAVLDHSSVGAHGSLESLDSTEAFTEALSNLKASIEESGARVECNELPRVFSNRVELVALFQNLIGNAIKYRGANPPVINVDAIPDGENWKYSVKDNGIGIAPRFHNQVFEMFQRLHGKGQYSGTGIGLAICKKIVESHQGKIWVESNVGEGSTFFFTLRGVPRPKEDKMTNKLEILLVEDSSADVRLTEEALKETFIDAHLTTVPDGEEAMDYLHHQGSNGGRPDVILLDLNMPKKNGHEVLAEIKAEPAFEDIPVVVLTASQEEEDILKALDTRMNFYLSKPVTPDRLEVLLKMIGELWQKPKLECCEGA